MVRPMPNSFNNLKRLELMYDDGSIVETDLLKIEEP